MNAQTHMAGAADRGSLPDWIAPGRTALMIIDMQVDFASPEGLLGRSGMDMAIVQPALAEAQRLAEGARKAGTPVIFVGLKTRADTDSRTWSTRSIRRGENGDVGICREDDVGSDFYGPQPAEGELVVYKIRYSGFFGTTMDMSLKARDIDTLVVCGLTTECCVDCTVRDAYHLDYNVFLATDACAAYEQDMHDGALKNLEANCAILVDTDQVLTAWQVA